MPNRARTRGHDWEREVRRNFKQRGKEDCETARYASRKIDDLGIDHVKTAPFLTQCKATKNNPSYQKLLPEMDDIEMFPDWVIPTVLHKKTGEKHCPHKGKYTILRYKDFIKLAVAAGFLDPSDDEEELYREGIEEKLDNMFR